MAEPAVARLRHKGGPSNAVPQNAAPTPSSGASPIARWARRLSWKETAGAFRTSWGQSFDAVEHIVTWGLEHRMLGQIDAIGVDKIQYSKGHKYLTLVY
jgi:hypothetical protein